MKGSGSIQILTDLDLGGQKHVDPKDPDPQHCLIGQNRQVWI
jgi:hypothetical protein